MTMRGRGDEAVSVIIGAILLTAILVGVMVTVRLSYVPVWAKEQEVAHMHDVATGMASLRASLDPQVVGGPAAAHVLALRPDDRPLVPGFPALDGLVFTPADAGFRVVMTSFIVTADPREVPPLAAFEETWMPLPDDPIVADDVQHFRLRLDRVGDPCDDTAREVEVVARDANGDWAGNFTFSQEKAPPDCHLLVRVTNATDDVVYGNPVSFHLSEPLSPYWVDVLDPEFQFDRLLAMAPKPVTLQVGTAGLSADMSMVYVTTDPTTGETELTGGVVPVVSIDQTYEGGTLVYSGVSQHFVDMDYVLENGVLMLAQEEGWTTVVAPHLAAHRDPDRLFVSVDVPSLVGESGAIAGTDTATVKLTPAGRREVQGLAPGLTLEATSREPDAWATSWRDALAAVDGLTEASSDALTDGNFRVSTGDTWTRLALAGPHPEPDIFDLFVTVRQADIGVELNG
jgi:hypothetical protein